MHRLGQTGLSFWSNMGQTAAGRHQGGAAAYSGCKGTRPMSASFRVIALLASGLATIAMPASAAEFGGDGPAPYRPPHPPRHWRSEYWALHAPNEFVAGVRGASPLTVPFYGHGWSPGPVFYYPPPRPCCY